MSTKNNKKKKDSKFYQIASDFMEVLYKIFKGLFVLIPISGDRFKRMFRFSLSFKISMVYSLLIFVSLLLFSFFMIGFFTLIVGKEIVSTVNHSIDNLNTYITDNSLEELSSNQTNVISTGSSYLYVYDDDNQRIFISSGAPELDLKKPLENERFSSSHIDDGFFLSISKAYYENNKPYYIQGSIDVSNFLRYFFILGAILFCVSLLIFIILPAFGFRLSRKMLFPIKKMTEDAKEITLFNLDKRLDVARSQDELKDLSETFNETLDRLQNSYEKQYQFISDASHELRTPISVIQGYANLLNRWGKDDKKVLDESVEAIKSESQNMKDLIEKLLFIARSESHHQPLEKSLFSINELLNEIVREYQTFDTIHHFSISVDGNLSLFADRKLIKQALRIFIDNATKFTPEHGQISLIAKMDGQKLLFTIADTGIGIDKDDLPKIFNRFYRADPSREKKSGGSGLGLSIAKVILDLHNAKIKVFSTPGKGTEITLIFQVKETIRIAKNKT